MIFLDEPQIRAEATSLLAIIPVAIVGAWRQNRFGNVRVRDGLVLGGALAASGVLIGVLVSNAVSERTLEVGFAALMLFVAAQFFAPGAQVRRPDLAKARARARP